MRTPLLAVLVALTSCSPSTTRNVVDALLSAADVACIISHEFMPDEQAIAKACSLKEDMAPTIRTVVGEHKAGVRRALVGANLCSKDAGK